MSEQSELACVSCETAFDPAPTGGFCPDCDTPHPDFEHGEADAEDDVEGGESDVGEAGEEEEAEAEAAETAADVDATPSGDDASPAYCRECGAEIGADAAPSGDTTACPDCGRAVDADASYCPGCGAEVGTDDAADGPEDEPTVVTAEADRDDGDASAADAEAAAAGAETPDPEIEAASDGGETAKTDAGSAGADTDSDSTDAVPAEVTLVVNGEEYTFEDGDTFGREDEGWLEDLVVAGGGADALSYISSEHIEFSIEDDGVYVTDVSRNGTLLNSTKLDGGTERVTDGDFLTLAGRAEVEVKF